MVSVRTYVRKGEMISKKGAERDEKGRVNKRKNMNVGVREGILKRE